MVITGLSAPEARTGGLTVKWLIAFLAVMTSFVARADLEWAYQVVDESLPYLTMYLHQPGLDFRIRCLKKGLL